LQERRVVEVVVRERRLRFAVSPLALAQLLLRPLALG